MKSLEIAPYSAKRPVVQYDVVAPQQVLHVAEGRKPAKIVGIDIRVRQTHAGPSRLPSLGK